MAAAKRVALVTGAGSGIGKSAALALLKNGYHVALVGRRKDMLEKTAAESGAKDRTLVLPADITKDEQVKEVFARTKSAWGRLDVLFNNAGMGAPAVPMEELPISKWREVVDLNLTAMFADHVVMLRGGRLHAAGAPDEVFTESALEAVYGCRLSVSREPETGLIRVLTPLAA